MKRGWRTPLWGAILMASLSTATVTGCATNSSYQMSVAQSQSKAFRAVKGALRECNYRIEDADEKTGFIEASHRLPGAASTARRYRVQIQVEERDGKVGISLRFLAPGGAVGSFDSEAAELKDAIRDHLDES